MRFGFLVFAAVLLVGCGGNSKTLSAIDECRDALNISSALTRETPSLDRTTLIARAKVKCEPILANDESFKILALEQRDKIFDGILGLKFEDEKIEPAETDIPKSLTGKVYRKNSKGEYEPFTTYGFWVQNVGIDYEEYVWVRYPDKDMIRQMK